ncbi:MAG: hypothetical protein U1D25_13265 [Hydrogenophaga sp.]|uniref:hypothetical protein n=1 Tax=Hydrogenophaga sp. TaxID=1904254 RepID=UPI002ABC3776|nr:hypothetical protein [Hydrogenophaga sp.]MDZ4189060.1 hypothetical protein [Hydrogenophaga sp.]
MITKNIKVSIGVGGHSNRISNRTALTAYAVVCLVIASFMAVWVILQEVAVNKISQSAPHTQVTLPLDESQPDDINEQSTPPLTAITLPSLEQQQAEIEAALKADIEKEAALKKQIERQRQLRKVDENMQIERPPVLEDRPKDASTPDTQTPATCPEPDRIVIAPDDEKYNTLISSKIPGSNSPANGACTVRSVSR